MNTSLLKSYAPEARRAFIEAVSAQAAKLGITATGSAEAKVEGDVLLVGGQAFPAAWAGPRTRLVERVKDHGFSQTMEAVAYTWFNRLAAIRYMELHGYLDHGYRVLSHPEGGGRPEILDHAADVDLAGLDRDKAVELKLDGNKDEELYRLLLKAQCNALHKAMPFLFEKVGAEDELLLPANLLHTDSLIRQLVESIDEDAWQEIEIIGWLYQFYVAEKKAEVSGGVVRAEDIPAATQLFTPNWIVKYMVQNSLGAQWLATYPKSPLKGQMDYYIEPAEQTEEVQAQLKMITPESLNPEELTLIDPACGSGHILVEAYDLFKAIYLERGYRLRDVPKLILEKNLFGLDIDPRAAQLTVFALMMKGRADDRRLFERDVKLNVMALVDSTGLNVDALDNGLDLASFGLKKSDFLALKTLFEHATTFGSLIQVPAGLAQKLPTLRKLSEVEDADMFAGKALKHLASLVQQAELLAANYDAVVANPPYMGSRAFNATLKSWIGDNYLGYEKDLFSAFIVRMLTLSQEHGFLGVMTSFVWMFIPSYERLRRDLLSEHTLWSLVQLHYDAFADAKAHVCTFAARRGHIPGLRSCFVRLAEFPGVEVQGPRTLEAVRDRNCGWFFEAVPDSFESIPGYPVAYWVTERMAALFANPKVGEFVRSEGSVKTGNNSRFLRFHWEMSRSRIGPRSKWRRHPRGGKFRKWYGSVLEVVDWSPAARAHYRSDHVARIPEEEFWDVGGICWSELTSAVTSFRVLLPEEIANNKSLTAYPIHERDAVPLLGFLNTCLVMKLLACLNPTIGMGVGDIVRLPWQLAVGQRVALGQTVPRLTTIARRDWDAYERSLDFESSPLLPPESSLTIVEAAIAARVSTAQGRILETKKLEEENNALFISGFRIGTEVSAEVPLAEVTLTANPAFRYATRLSPEEGWDRFREDCVRELLSYAVGCMMGRYSLDEPGLIYANSGNEGFDANRYKRFPADEDGIVPLTDTEWFEDDACLRLIEFISVAWDKAHLEDNLTFLAANLSPKKNESSRETIRRYLCANFFKDHLKTYKKRPIYWLFASGKKKAFQCLVYLHRYNEGTLARMRDTYVIPLQGKMAARVKKLTGDIQTATSTTHSKRLQKEKAKLEKQQVELIAFDEKLRHCADAKISLDLDDGVKVNYGKFGDLLAEVKAVHGKKPVTA